MSAETPPREAATAGAVGEQSDSMTVARGAGVSLFGSVAQAVFRAASSLLIAHSLGAERFGIFALANRVTQMGTTLSAAGQGDAVMHFVGKYRGEQAPGKAVGAFRISLALSLLTSIALSVALYVSAPWIVERFFENEQVTDVIRVLALAVVPSVLFPLYLAGLRASRNIRDAVLIRTVLLPFLRLLIFAALLLFGLRIFGLVWAIIASLTIVSIVGAWRLARTANWMPHGGEARVRGPSGCPLFPCR